MTASHLSPELRSLVKSSVSVLGEVVARELGRDSYRRIEGIRRRMTALRDGSAALQQKELRRLYRQLQRCAPLERAEIASAFTLMLELMNSCENAYRSYRIAFDPHGKVCPSTFQITYVLTSHPTEARSPANIRIFEQIQDL